MITTCNCGESGATEYHRWPTLSDPTHFTIWGDESVQAMEETNWEVIVDEFEAIGIDLEPAHDAFSHSGEPHAFIGGSWGECRYAVHTLPETPADDLAEKLAGRLEDYPLLDEMAYSEREFEAWNAWWPTFGFEDFIASRGPQVRDWCTLGDVIDALKGQQHNRSRVLIRWATFGSRDIEDIFNMTQLASDVGEGMAYWDGFSGEYDEPAATEALVAAVVAAAAAYTAA